MKDEENKDIAQFICKILIEKQYPHIIWINFNLLKT